MLHPFQQKSYTAAKKSEAVGQPPNSMHLASQDNASLDMAANLNLLPQEDAFLRSHQLLKESAWPTNEESELSLAAFQGLTLDPADGPDRQFLQAASPTGQNDFKKRRVHSPPMHPHQPEAGSGSELRNLFYGTQLAEASGAMQWDLPNKPPSPNPTVGDADLFNWDLSFDDLILPELEYPGHANPANQPPENSAASSPTHKRKQPHQSANPIPPASLSLSVQPPPPRRNFSVKFKELANSLLSQSTYGKNLQELLSPQKGFKAVSENGGLHLLNYEASPQFQPPYQGVCNHLTYSVGKALQGRLDNDFELKVGKGTYQEFFSVHYFLLAWHKSKNHKINARQAKQEIPRCCMIIDPSFKQMIPPYINNHGRKHYQLNDILDLEQLHPDNMAAVTFNPFSYPAILPIGFLRDVIPEATKEYGQQAMLFLKFDQSHIPGDPPLVLPVIQTNPHSIATRRIAHTLLSQTPNDNPFRQFYKKVLVDLHPESEEPDIPDSLMPEPGDLEGFLPSDLRMFDPEEWQA